jgi:hypothetical protein
MAKLTRTSCEACGDPLEGPWFSRHLGKGVQRLCPDCTSDALGRLEADACQQIAELEDCWRLPAWRIGSPDGDDAGADEAAP